MWRVWRLAHLELLFCRRIVHHRANDCHKLWSEVHGHLVLLEQVEHSIKQSSLLVTAIRREHAQNFLPTLHW